MQYQVRIELAQIHQTIKRGLKRRRRGPGVCRRRLAWDDWVFGCRGTQGRRSKAGRGDACHGRARCHVQRNAAPAHIGTAMPAIVTTAADYAPHRLARNVARRLSTRGHCFCWIWRASRAPDGRGSHIRAGRGADCCKTRGACLAAAPLSPCRAGLARPALRVPEAGRGGGAGWLLQASQCGRSCARIQAGGRRARIGRRARSWRFVQRVVTGAPAVNAGGPAPSPCARRAMPRRPMPSYF